MSLAMNPLGYSQQQYGYNNSAMQNNNNNNNNNNNKNNGHQYYPQQQYINYLPEQPSAGGVCENIDYDFKMMTEFVVQNAYLTFDKEIILDFDNKSMDNSEVVEIFTNGVNFVLKSIRLPQSTIYLALNYLHKSVNKLKKKTKNSLIYSNAGENVIYQNLVIALVLANKFNDDKTFTNKSWSEATGMDLKTINKMEKEWLATFNWNLNDSIFETKLFPEYSKSFGIYSAAMNFKRESFSSASCSNMVSNNVMAPMSSHMAPPPQQIVEYADASPLLNYNYNGYAPNQCYKNNGNSVSPVSMNGFDTPITFPSMLNSSSNNYFFSSASGQNDGSEFYAQAAQNRGISSPLNHYYPQYDCANQGMPSLPSQQQQQHMPMPMHMQPQMPMHMSMPPQQAYQQTQPLFFQQQSAYY